MISPVVESEPHRSTLPRAQGKEPASLQAPLLAMSKPNEGIEKVYSTLDLVAKLR